MQSSPGVQGSAMKTLVTTNLIKQFNPLHPADMDIIKIKESKLSKAKAIQSLEPATRQQPLDVQKIKSGELWKQLKNENAEGINRYLNFAFLLIEQSQYFLLQLSGL